MLAPGAVTQDPVDWLAAKPSFDTTEPSTTYEVPRNLLAEAPLAMSPVTDQAALALVVPWVMAVPPVVKPVP